MQFHRIRGLWSLLSRRGLSRKRLALIKAYSR